MLGEDNSLGSDLTSRIMLDDLNGMLAADRLTWSRVNKFSYRQYRLMSAPVVNKSLFVTKEGYIGIAPTSIASGDIVCVLKGLSVPVVIRKRGEGYKLIGACFVLDFMDGLAMEWVDQGLAELTTFNIT